MAIQTDPKEAQKLAKLGKSYGIGADNPQVNFYKAMVQSEPKNWLASAFEAPSPVTNNYDDPFTPYPISIPTQVPTFNRPEKSLGTYELERINETKAFINAIRSRWDYEASSTNYENIKHKINAAWRVSQTFSDLTYYGKFEGEFTPWPYRTQKAKGLTRPLTSVQPMFVNSNIKFIVFPWDLPLDFDVFNFARPAPTTPRHGFVDSRKISSHKELMEIWNEVMQADPEGELILMPTINASHSAVATVAGVSWGKGNDGATSGLQSIVIPTPGNNQAWLENIGGHHPETIGLKTSAYVELVHGHLGDKHEPDYLYIVQRRDGPVPVFDKDFIPKDVRVRKVIREWDAVERGKEVTLLDWEKFIHALPDKDTTVFYHRGSLASHYAVHAIENGVAVVTGDKKPIVGDCLKKIKDRPRLTDDDLIDVREQTIKYFNSDIPKDEDQTKLMAQHVMASIATMHSQSVWNNAPHLLRLRGMAAGLLVRYLAATCFGEMRYWRDNGPGGTHGVESQTPDVNTSYRESAYRKFFKDHHSFDQYEEVFHNMAMDFKTMGWNDGYGGDKWGDVALQGKELVKALKKFTSRSSISISDDWKKVIISMNIAIHTSHNNGVALNKFINGQHLTKIAETPAWGFLSPFIGKLMMEYIK